MTLVVRQAEDWRELEQEFDAVVARVYDRDAWYAQPSRRSLERSLDQTDFQGRQRFFLVERDGEPVARLAARLPSTANPVCDWGTIGAFESLDDPPAATTLLQEAAAWLLGHGAARVIGPMDGDTWHRYRFSIGPFDEPPFLMEPYNPPYYGALWERAGYVLLETYHSKQLPDVAPAVERFKAIHDRTLSRGYSLHAFQLKHFTDELERLHWLSLAIFSGNKLYTPITLDEFRQLYLPARSLLDPRLVWFARSPQGEDVGFLFAVHDYFRAALAMRGGDGWLAKLRFWLNKRRATAINVKSMGVAPGHRHSGIGVTLMSQVYRQILTMGFQKANLCLIHDDNPSSRLDAGLGSVLRRYALYHYGEGE